MRPAWRAEFWAGSDRARCTCPTRRCNLPSPKTFDEYHLYSLERPATLLDKETKQVEFIRANHVAAKQVYVYDGLKLDHNQYQGWNLDMIRNNSEYGTVSNNKVWVMQEFKNSEANHLGMPLPAGRVRFYRQDTDGQLEFTGENEIANTPKDETVRMFTGSAFDLTGERKRTTYQVDMGRREIDEGFEIKLRNHKKETVENRVVEHLYRGMTWEIPQSSTAFVKTDSQTAEFRLTLAPDEEKTGDLPGTLFVVMMRSSAGPLCGIDAIPSAIASCEGSSDVRRRADSSRVVAVTMAGTERRGNTVAFAMKRPCTVSCFAVTARSQATGDFRQRPAYGCAGARLQ